MLLRSVKRRAKREGKGLVDVLLDLLYSAETADRDKIAIVKLVWDRTMAQMTEGGVTDRALGPAVYLPQHRPVLTAIVGGKGS